MTDEYDMTRPRSTTKNFAPLMMLGLGAIVFAASPTRAGSDPTDNTRPPPAGHIEGLTPVDAGRPDMSPFALSFRRLQIDLRRPLGFDQVYQIDPAPPMIGAVGRPVGAPRYARRSGALTAVFPRSEYMATEDGVKVVVPPDTRFYIGSVEDVLRPAGSALGAAHTAPALHAADTGASTVADHRADRVADRTGARPAPSTPQASTPVATDRAREGMMTSETYRVHRVRALLDEAARAAEAEPAPRP